MAQTGEEANFSTPGYREFHSRQEESEKKSVNNRSEAIGNSPFETGSKQTPFKQSAHHNETMTMPPVRPWILHSIDGKQRGFLRREELCETIAGL